MGNSSRSPEDYEIVTKYRQQDWIHESNDEGIQIWRNRFTNEAAEVYQLYGVPSIEDMDIYTTRTMENDLIKVYCLSIEPNKDLCSINRFAQLLVEHIPIKLNNIHNIDRQEALTVLSAAFRGFHLLEIKFGAIVPSEEHIGFNEHGKTKIWLNRNTYYNYADKEATLNEQLSQISIVSNRVNILFQMVEARTRYLLVPPIIKEEICNPFTTYLSALKVLEKFAYFQKLNLRKYLQLFQHRKKQQSTKFTRQNNTRNPSTVTENKLKHQMCCYQNESVFNVSRMENSIQLRRIYSLNNIHNQSNNSSMPVPPVNLPQILRGVQKSQKQSFVKHSTVSNNSSFIQSVIRGEYMNQSKNIESRVQHIPKSQVEIQKLEEKHLDHQVIKQNKDLLGETNHLNELAKSQQLKLAIKDSGQVLQLRDISSNHNQLKVINKIENLLEGNQDQQFQSNWEHKSKEDFNQPSSPTFVYFPQAKCELISFASSKQNIQQSDDALNKSIIKQDSFAHNDLIQLGTTCHNIKQGGYLKVQSKRFYNTNKSQEQIDEQRRFSIQNKASKLQFLPEFVINSKNLLNLCTQVQSKLHMATNREHSIIQSEVKHDIFIHSNKNQNEQLQQYEIEKYGKISRLKGKNRQQQPFKTKRIQNKQAYQSQKSSVNQNIKNILNYRHQTSLTNFGGEEDFLDVNFLEKSLDKRYSNNQHQLKLEQKKKEIEQNDTLNIAKLEEGMLKFSKSQLNQKNVSPNIKQNDSISKKNQYIGALQKDQPLEDIGSRQHVKQYSTGFEHFYPFRQKKSNEQRYQKNTYLLQKSLKNETFQRKISRFQPYDNKKDYSFEGNSRSLCNDQHNSYQKPITTSYYIKQIELSDQNKKSKLRSNQGIQQQQEFIPFDVRDQKYQETLGKEQNKYQKNSSQLKGVPAKKISYEQLRQILWN